MLRKPLKHQLARLTNFLRPKPQKIPLSIDQIYDSTKAKTTVEEFNDLYYASGVARELKWKGSPILKNPCDLWMLVELMQCLRPTAIVETGTHFGGSALFLADMAATLEIDCTVITIDYNPKWSIDPTSKNIISIQGYTTDRAVAQRVHAHVDDIKQARGGHTMVLLDADHSEENVLAEMEEYSRLGRVHK